MRHSHPFHDVDLAYGTVGLVFFLLFVVLALYGPEIADGVADWTLKVVR